MTTHILLACTQSAAVKSARKWGWEPAVLKIGGRMAFIDPDGDAVVVSSSAADVDWLDKAAKVYLGEAWSFAYGDPHDGLRAHMSKGGRVLVDNWKAGKMEGFTAPPYAI